MKTFKEFMMYIFKEGDDDIDTEMNTEKEYEKWYNSLTAKQIEDYESDYNRYKSIMESGDEDIKRLLEI